MDVCFLSPENPRCGRPSEMRKRLKNTIRTHVAPEHRHRRYDNEQQKQKYNNIYQLRPTPSLLLPYTPPTTLITEHPLSAAHPIDISPPDLGVFLLVCYAVPLLRTDGESQPPLPIKFRPHRWRNKYHDPDFISEKNHNQHNSNSTHHYTRKSY